MKTIAVLIPTYSVEYSQEFLSGIYDFFNDKDVRVIISQTRYPHDTVTMYNYQYWSSFELLKSLQVDGVIFVSGLYCSMMSLKSFVAQVKKFTNKKIFSVAIDLKMKKVTSVVSDCDEVFDEIVNHLKNVHKCKKIAFLSANSTKSSEALARYDAFIKAMKNHNLEFDTGLEIDGNFTDFDTEAAFEKKFTSKEQIDFDAIVSANDSMASGAITALNKLGLSVPEDIKITGFDDSVISRISSPKISTINQNIYGLGIQLGEMAYKAVMDIPDDSGKSSSLYPLYRQSCGCISCKDNGWIFKDKNGKIQQDSNDQVKNLGQYAQIMEERNNVITLMDMVKSSNTLRQFYYNLDHLVRQIGFDNMAICLYKEPYFLDADDDFKVPENVEFKMYSDLQNDKKDFLENCTIDPEKELIPEGYLDNSTGIHIFQPIFSGESNYGYMICKLKYKKFAEYNVYLKILVNSLAQSYEYTNQLLITERLISEDSDLANKSKTDELTGILNRRGFKELGQRAIDVAQETDSPVVVFFSDMDGLKKINDTYGHEMGAKAIKLQAQVLKHAFRSKDIVGRLSGDEFGIVAVGMKMERVQAVHDQIDQLNAKISKKHKLPFVLSTSIGAVSLETSSVLNRLLTEADKKLYNEKRIKHSVNNIKIE